MHKFGGKKLLLWISIILGLISVITIVLLLFETWDVLKNFRLHYTPIHVKKGTIRAQIVFPGSIDFSEHVTLQFQQIPTTGALISWVGVKVGDFVQKNQTIASLDQQAILKQQQLNLAQFLKQRYTFDQSTSDNGGRTPDQALNDTQKRVLQSSQLDLNSSVYNVELQDLVSRLSNIVSPIDGIVTRVDTPVAGVNIQSADEAKFEVVNPSKLFFSIDVDETEVNNLHVGDKGILILNAYPTDFIQSTIINIAFSPHLDANNNTVYTVKLTLDDKGNSDYRYKLGMNGNMVFYEYADNILSIPNDYVHLDDNGNYIYIGHDRKKEYVQIGVTDGKMTEIMKGVGPDDIIYY